MYRNYGNFSGGSDPSSGAGSPTAGANSGTVDSADSTSQQQQSLPPSHSSSSLSLPQSSLLPPQQKYSLGASAQFVPSLNAITSSQDLQWLVQPSLWSQPGPSAPPLPPPFPPPPAMCRSSPPHLHHPGMGSRVATTTRRRPDEHLTPEELERRRIRRERNKMAAAKCRNRRRVLTDTLQNETDRLESDKAELQKEIAGLEKEKEKLELVLEAHKPICKIQSSDSDSDSSSSGGPSGPAGRGRIKTESPDSTSPPGPSSCKKCPAKPKITLPAPQSPSEPEFLHTPTLASTPSLTPFTASLIFTYPPTAPLDSSHLSPTPPSCSSALGTVQSVPSQKPQQPCSTAHRRSSSSGDQSDHSLNSPTILTL
ncbi:hypothetical protein JZ751_024415 [Albula glossodonta]|uniref:BZIP domain-containing protein n=1 Tax=Albula glossodonta TaxID=121402 RepID=A0A8T2NN17_9TELE|nr:hypothetical protein JZ751_013867 [Albula glossodonta]KAG9339012.1 hypothetical protein JZ751_024415 [Albula glossodonta]